MKIGLFSDAHGNIDALKACHGALRSMQIEKVFFLGDAIGYLPYSVDCLSFIQDWGFDCIKGNHEAMLLGLLPLTAEKDEYFRICELREHISPGLLNFVDGWPDHREVTFDGRRVLLVHGSPSNRLGGYVYPDTNLAEYEDLPYDVIIMGQTHRPFLRREYGKIFVNIGSVGLPRDTGNLSSFAIIDTDTWHIEVFRQQFDIGALLTNKEIHPKIKKVFLRRTNHIYGSDLTHKSTI